MAIKKHYYLTIDTETAGNLDYPYVYNLGGILYDRTGLEYLRFSFLIDDIYNEEQEIMQTAYYAEKLPKYEKELREGTIEVISMADAKKYIDDICKRFDVTAIVAHNAFFDYKALNNTMNYCSNELVPYFYPYGVELWDTLAMARSVIAKMPTYQAFCKKHGYLTKRGQVRLTAEVLYRYISNNNDFIEEHKALEDCEIEKEILLYCFRQHKKMTRNLFNQEKAKAKREKLEKQVLQEFDKHALVKTLTNTQLRNLAKVEG